MIISNSILHIVDNGTGQLVYSTNPLDLTNEDVYNFVEQKLERILHSDTKHGIFTEQDYFQEILKDETEDFNHKAKILSTHFYSALEKTQDGTYGDFLIAQFTEEVKTYYAILKLDYAKSFTHLVDYEEELLTNKIIKHKAIYRTSGIAKDEGVLFNVTDSTFKLHDKIYRIDNEPSRYLSEQFLKLNPDMSVQEQLSEIKKAVKRAVKVHHEDHVESMIEAQNAMHESLEEFGCIDKEFVGERVFGKNQAAKADYMELLEEKAVEDKITPADFERVERKYGTQKIILDNGIELSIPVALYKDKSVVEFVTNEDGTTSVMLKNIESYINKF